MSGLGACRADLSPAQFIPSRLGATFNGSARNAARADPGEPEVTLAVEWVKYAHTSGETNGS